MEKKDQQTAPASASQGALLHYKTVLSIAGSDSIGGAGIQADIKTCDALGAYAMTAITAVTAQNTCGVMDYEAVTPTLLRKQLDAVIADVHPDAVKIGMVPTVEHVRVIADWIKENKIGKVVLDPVCVATSGDALAADSVPAALRDLLMPLATVVTPNVPEAEVLAAVKITRANMDDSMMALLRQTHAGAIVLKGGHMSGDKSEDFIYQYGSDQIGAVASGRIDTVNTHGTGCTFSTAIAVYLAAGLDVTHAVQHAKAYISHAIAYGAQFELGHGHGPVCHNYAKFLDK